MPQAVAPTAHRVIEVWALALLTLAGGTDGTAGGYRSHGFLDLVLLVFEHGVGDSV